MLICQRSDAQEQDAYGAAPARRNATEFAGHSDPETTKKHYLNEPVKLKPIR